MEKIQFNTLVLSIIVVLSLAACTPKITIETEDEPIEHPEICAGGFPNPELYEFCSSLCEDTGFKSYTRLNNNRFDCICKDDITRTINCRTGQQEK